MIIEKGDQHKNTFLKRLGECIQFEKTEQKTYFIKKGT